MQVSVGKNLLATPAPSPMHSAKPAPGAAKKKPVATAPALLAATFLRATNFRGEKSPAPWSAAVLFGTHVPWASRPWLDGQVVGKDTNDQHLLGWVGVKNARRPRTWAVVGITRGSGGEPRGRGRP